MQLLRKIAALFARHPFIRSAIEERADLSAFQGPPPLSVIIGVPAIALSFLISWPAISVLGVLALKWKMPLLFAIGSPILYGCSHLMFIFGMALSGAKYSLVFLRWGVRMIFERFAEPAPETRG